MALDGELTKEYGPVLVVTLGDNVFINTDSFDAGLGPGPARLEPGLSPLMGTILLAVTAMVLVLTGALLLRRRLNWTREYCEINKQ